MTKEIQLTQGQVAIVDDEDYEYLSQYKWRAQNNGDGKYYAVREQWIGRKAILMHRDIMKCPSSKQVDHIDNNGLNNIKENLRICTSLENSRNRKVRKDSKTGIKGVKYQEGKYRTRITVNGIVMELGVYNTVEEASRIYNNAALKYFGAFAKNSEAK
jgi:hypothetical protein